MERAPSPGRRTRLVATIGPASIDRVGELVAAGLDVARVNLSHGTAEEHRAAARAVRSASASAGRHVALLVDLPGPKIRLGDLAGGGIDLEAGERVVLGRPGAVGATDLPVRESAVVPALRRGDRILLADGAAELRVAAGGGDDPIDAEVVRGGHVRSGAGVNVPAERIDADDVSAADDPYLPRLLELEADLVGQSFVRSVAEVRALRSRLPETMAIVAKIETQPAVDDIEAIVTAADAVMVARGDLGVELPFELVPHVQKDIVRAALDAGVPSIVATQMLESMVAAPRPTRAEASDVANAILDGCDAVMLSAETAIGDFPLESLRAAARIAAAADERVSATTGSAAFEPDVDARATAHAAVTMAERDPDVAALACFTRTGRTARLLSALRPTVPVVAVTRSASVARSLGLARGVHAAVATPEGPDIDIVEHVLAAAMDVAAVGDGLAGRALVVVTSSGTGGPNRVEVVRATG